MHKPKMCDRCKKRQAVVFVAGIYGDKQTQTTGLCLTCARQLHIPQIDQCFSNADIPDDMLEEMENSFAQMSADGHNPFSELMQAFPDIALSDDDDDECNEGGTVEDEDEDSDDCDGENDAACAPSLDSFGISPSEMPASLAELFDSICNDEDEDDSDDASADDDEDNNDDGESHSNEKGERRSPFGGIPLFGFGSNFHPGGTAYNDGGKGRKSKEYKSLNDYCTNLTARAAAGRIDRIIGRDKEIERIVQILSRRQKNNPCLIGEPGVGKTAIAEGLALRIVAGNVPQRLAEKELFLLDLTALVAGTQFRGQFESRIKGLIDEVKAKGNVILFIDEVHNLVGTGDAEGSMNAANILKPALSRGELQVIGATTFTEYRKHIEKDTALERRFQPVKIEEPSIEDTICVLRGIKDYYEQHHGVTFSDALISRAVNLSERYITDRFLPDKAIDLLDEACACASLRNKAREESVMLRKKIDRNTKELAKLEEKLESGKGEPDYEKMALLKSQNLQYGSRVDELAPEADNCAVTEADLAKVIELWTGIQASRIEESEFKKLAHLAERIKEKIKGQDEAVDLVAAAIRRSRVQISPHRRPASFIFVGPTGVGKTELVKVLAGELFDTPETLIRLDMSEFMEKHSVSRLIGSPPGYVGYDEAGQLTEKVRRKPYSVLLFDEIEKAHPDVMNILLQILDEGRITDAQGRTVSFENTVLIMTSNAGSDSHTGMLGFGKTENELEKEKTMKALGEFLRPEFLARVDEVVCFNTLGDEDFRAIARLMCDEYVAPVREKGIELVVSDSAVAWFAEHAKDGKSAARDLRNLIRRELEDRLAALIVESGDNMPAFAYVDAQDDKLTVTPR